MGISCVMKTSLSRRSLSWFFPVLAFLSSLHSARPATNSVDPGNALAGFDEFAEEALKDWNVPGLAVAVVHKDHIVYAKGFGFRDREKKLPVTTNTLFAIGSTTKAMTTFLIGTLVDEGKEIGRAHV